MERDWFWGCYGSDGMCVRCMYVSMCSCLTQICMCMSRSTHIQQIGRSITCEAVLAVAWRLKIASLLGMFAGMQSTRKHAHWFIGTEILHWYIQHLIFYFIFFFFKSWKSFLFSSVFLTFSWSFKQRFISHLSQINVVSECWHPSVTLIE